jgi:mannose-6-phosphate isomerase-like protein (cupin superfamily)
MPERRPVIVAPGAGRRFGNVEFLARSEDTPRFNACIVTLTPGRRLEQHVHADEDDSFYILSGTLTFELGDERVAAVPGTFVFVPPGVSHGFANEGDEEVRMLNIHAPAGFDLRIEASD